MDGVSCQWEILLKTSSSAAYPAPRVAGTEISHEIRGFLFSKNSDNMMYQKALTHFG
jgi:hypothetical protein